ncbi:substrate-binding periplasmic protein [Alteromonas ponticola]|uniref:Transporter substrate-binding domain-containing protein n=1 Tax=Alteromonas ponticola TaxID=2720613 RepID=A0ABX1QYF5_9ALTE|nr:transporter substrate-binding domain-containing protein [Alteromonas ponticola]NMH59249.1 transporter substrate-binding domain-containing protein [Alteromonas ponticola]
MSITTKARMAAMLLFFFVSAGLANGEQAKKVIRFYSEIAPPYFYLDEDGETKGAMVDLANALFSETGIHATLEQLPWARAYHEATHSPNSVLMLVLETPSRESELQWLGLVHVAKASLLKLSHRNNVNVTNLEQAKHWRVATVRGYGSAAYLKANGFSEQTNLTLVKNTRQLWTLLYMERVDFVLTNTVSGKHEVENAGLDATKLESVLDIDELSLPLQMATGLNTDRALVTTLRNGLKTLKQNGEYERILRKWGLWES